MGDFVDPVLTTPPLELQQEAVARFLASGEFSRSPNLEKIFRYLTQEYFAGRSGEIKEFTIATEALGRGVDFDPKRDSIVRVEMHRLRRRLREYYARVAGNETVHIGLPEKSYAPEFSYASGSAPPAASEYAITDTQPDETAPQPAPQTALETVAVPLEVSSISTVSRQARWHWTLAGLAMVAAIFLVWRFWSADNTPSAAAPSTPSTLPASQPSPAIPPGSEIRILAGRTGGRFVDRFGQTWLADQFATGGNAVPVSKEIRTMGLDPNLFAGMREGDFTYDIPLADQPYEMTLYFAESEYGGENPVGGADASRSFHVQINGKPALNNFDPITSGNEWGAATAKVFRDLRPAEDGKLHLRFQSSFSGKAFVNAIELRPGIEGRLRPIRLTCQPQAFRDSQNRVWQPNVYFHGGKQITRPMGAPVERDGDLFRGERYGRFSFAIPVAPGSYTVKLYFWEYWWGPGRPGLGGKGSRQFSVFANFKPLVENLDIVAQSDENQFLVKTFTGIRPDTEGRINLDFVPQVNYAMVNALEILDEGKP
jgi:hypothetical protein